MGKQTGKLTHAEQEAAGGRGLNSEWGSRSPLQRITPVRGASPGLPGAKGDKIPEITPRLCLHGKEHVGSIEQETFFCLILSFLVCRIRLLLMRLMCLRVRVK